MNGILLVDKPKNWTSFDVVNRVRHLIQKSELNVSGKKRFPVGHTGTLDPQATGLLVLLLGTYTKRAPELNKLDKTYDVTLQLGTVSTTGDSEGEMTKRSEVQPPAQRVEEVLKTFVGPGMQTPPAFSAVKIDGKRAYKLAREGKTVMLEPRPVVIHSITNVMYDYPTVRFTTRVSSGTYIRSLAEDIGKKLETGAYMSDLRRTSVGDFELSQAITVADISLEAIKKHTITLA